MVNRHEKRKIQTKKKLKEAALELVLDGGYERLSIQEITDRADLGRGTFYLHFNDKEDVVWSIIKDAIDAEDRAAHVDFGDSLPEQAEYYGYVRMFKHAANQKDLYLLMLGSQGSSSLTMRVQEYLAEEFKREMREGTLYREMVGPPEILAQVVTGALVRMIIWWLQKEDHTTPGQMAALLYETLHHREAPQNARG